MSNSQPVKVFQLGRVEYEKGFEMQSKLHTLYLQGKHQEAILMLEHEEILTLGKNSSPDHFIEPMVKLEQQGIRVIQTERGGEVTAHMPGQLIAYPILDLSKRGFGARDYVEKLEAAVIELLARHSIEARRDQQYPGVWVEDEKICAIGIRIKKRVSMHGIALNVNNELSLFSRIIPCGIKDRGVTSMSKLLGNGIDFEELRYELLGCLAKNLGIEVYEVCSSDE